MPDEVDCEIIEVPCLWLDKKNLTLTLSWEERECNQSGINPDATKKEGRWSS